MFSILDNDKHGMVVAVMEEQHYEHDFYHDIFFVLDRELEPSGKYERNFWNPKSYLYPLSGLHRNKRMKIVAYPLEVTMAERRCNLISSRSDRDDMLHWVADISDHVVFTTYKFQFDRIKEVPRRDVFVGKTFRKGRLDDFIQEHNTTTCH